MGDEATLEHSSMCGRQRLLSEGTRAAMILDRTLIASIAAMQLALGPIDEQGYFGILPRPLINRFILSLEYLTGEWRKRSVARANRSMHPSNLT
jgi:hypothetical protein